MKRVVVLYKCQLCESLFVKRKIKTCNYVIESFEPTMHDCREGIKGLATFIAVATLQENLQENDELYLEKGQPIIHRTYYVGNDFPTERNGENK